MFTGTLYTLNSASCERETSISQGNIQRWIISFILQDPSIWPCLHSYLAGRAPFGKGSHLDLWLGLKVEGSWGWKEGKCFAAESTVRVKALMEKGKKGRGWTHVRAVETVHCLCGRLCSLHVWFTPEEWGGTLSTMKPPVFMKVINVV